jgi:hypothetical protein
VTPIHHEESPVSLPIDVPAAYASAMALSVHNTCSDCAQSSTALHALSAHLCVHALSRTDFYRKIYAVTPTLLGPDAPLRAHTDGGSMATTTDHRDYLWDYRELTPAERRPVLRVADSRAHHPIGIGFLRVHNVRQDITWQNASIHPASLPQFYLQVPWLANINVLRGIRQH